MEKEIKANVDINEPFEVIDAVATHPEIDDYDLEELPAGDIEILGVGFERKTVSDYASSILEGRLQEQTKKLGSMYEYAYVLVDGDLSETEDQEHTNIRPESLRGSMCSLTARENSGVQSVICCSETSLMVDMAVRLARKHTEEESKPYLPTGSIDSDQPTTKMIYGCLPGVGVTMAEDLHQEYPSMTVFMENATVESLCEIDGIGEVTARKIMDALL